MRNYKSSIVSVNEIESVVCNCCGEHIKKTGNGKLEDYLSIEKRWGYLSPYDNEVHSFDICVDCYTKITESFKIFFK